MKLLLGQFYFLAVEAVPRTLLILFFFFNGILLPSAEVQAASPAALILAERPQAAVADRRYSGAKRRYNCFVNQLG